MCSCLPTTDWCCAIIRQCVLARLLSVLPQLQNPHVWLVCISSYYLPHRTKNMHLIEQSLCHGSVPRYIVAQGKRLKKKKGQSSLTCMNLNVYRWGCLFLSIMEGHTWICDSLGLWFHVFGFIVSFPITLDVSVKCIFKSWLLCFVTPTAFIIWTTLAKATRVHTEML